VFASTGEWVTVVDKKKEKREADAKAKRDEAKRLKSAAKQQANAELSADEQAEKAAKEAAKLAEAKAKRDKANVKPQISNEKQLLDALMQVVASDPSKVMQLSTIGDRMQVCCNVLLLVFQS
jgi:membrane protein involved in colicin uptake